MVIRQRAEAIRVSGRNTSGVRLIRLNADDAVTAIAIVTSEDEEEKQLEAADKARALTSASEEKDENIEQNDLFDDSKNASHKKKALKKQKTENKGKEKLISKNQKKSVIKKKEKPVQKKKKAKQSVSVKQKSIPKPQKAKRNTKKTGKK